MCRMKPVKLFSGLIIPKVPLEHQIPETLGYVGSLQEQHRVDQIQARLQTLHGCYFLLHHQPLRTLGIQKYRHGL